MSNLAGWVTAAIGAAFVTIASIWLLSLSTNPGLPNPTSYTQPVRASHAADRVVHLAPSGGARER
jgi:hypothetical protein